ncbi:MAG: J domain-containing protein [Dehalococcoidia bacterium]|nr:J domain-containing protein [Dehalococcoidia bacterium]
MGDSSDLAHYETLQVSPTAEPEVIAAAYRALAKKYHPDRSDAADAMGHMARLNAAYQALKSGSGSLTTGGDSSPQMTVPAPGRFSPERLDPTAPLEHIMGGINRMVTTARQRIIDELEADGLARDTATNLVATVLRSLVSGSQDSRKATPRRAPVRLDSNTSYDDAIRAVTERAQSARDQLVDELVAQGLNRGAAQELVDSALEQVRGKTRASGTASARLSPERVDLTGPLDAGVQVVARKIRAALQLVIDELTREGVPQKTAEQLVKTAADRTKPGHSDGR